MSRHYLHGFEHRLRANATAPNLPGNHLVACGLKIGTGAERAVAVASHLLVVAALSEFPVVAGGIVTFTKRERSFMSLFGNYHIPLPVCHRSAAPKLQGSSASGRIKISG